MAKQDALVIDIEKVLRDKAGSKARYVPRFAINWLKRIVHQDELNAFMIENKDIEGVQWLRAVLDHLEMKIVIKGEENLPPVDCEKAYTFVSNHPLGGIDGVALGAILGERYNCRIRYILNDILMNVPGLRPIGVPVNVVGGQNRETLSRVDEVFKSDNHLIMFPAALCSRKIRGRVQDVEWKKMVVQKTVQARRDVVPIHFSGQNSKRFYRVANWSKWLGLKFNVAMLFLVDELYLNRGKQFVVTIGKPISFETFDRTRSAHEWAQWLRGEIYRLKDKEA